MKFKKRVARSRMRQVPEPLQSPLFDTPLRDNHSFSTNVLEQLALVDKEFTTISRGTTADGSPMRQKRRNGIRFEGEDSEGKRIITSSASSVCSRCGKIVSWRAKACRWCKRISGSRG